MPVTDGNHYIRFSAFRQLVRREKKLEIREKTWMKTPFFPMAAPFVPQPGPDWKFIAEWYSVRPNRGERPAPFNLLRSRPFKKQSILSAIINGFSHSIVL